MKNNIPTQPGWYFARQIALNSNEPLECVLVTREDSEYLFWHSVNYGSGTRMDFFFWLGKVPMPVEVQGK